jgi:ribosomal protein S18 acetylase RimI-like enzyme
MTEMRRLDVPKKGDLFERGRTSPVRAFEIERAEFERVQRERPKLIASDEAGVELLLLRGDLAWLSYGFDSLDALRGHFQPLLTKILAALRDGGQAGVFLRFTDHPNRPYIEPVLDESLFQALYEYMEMDLRELPTEWPPSEEFVAGIELCSTGPSDSKGIDALVQAIFGEDAARQSIIEDNLRRSANVRVLEEQRTGKVVAFFGCLLGSDRTGEIPVMGVHPDFQRRGLGEVILRWTLVWFREQGMRRARLIVRADNAAAIALYRKLGFVPGRRGLMYRRPTTKRELDEIASKRKGTYIKFGGWR